MHRPPMLSGKEARVSDRSTTSQALESLRTLSLPALATSAMSLFGAPTSKSVTPLLCWGSDSPVGGSAFLSPRVSPLPLLLLPPLRWPGVVVRHLGHLSLPPLYPVISVNPLASSPCYLLRPRRRLPLCLERHRLRVLGWSRSSHPLYPLWSWDRPHPPLHPLFLLFRWEALLLLIAPETSPQCRWTRFSSIIPIPLTSCTFGKRRLFGLSKTSTTASSPLVWFDSSPPPNPPVRKPLVVAEGEAIVEPK